MSFDDTYGNTSLSEVRDAADTNAHVVGPTGLAHTKKTWTRDRETLNCIGCTRKFTKLLRKHHCRGCGKVFCDKCTRQKELLVKGNKKMKKERVCTSCSTDHAIDREELLFKLLGPELGPLYYYLFKRAGYGELHALTELEADKLEEVYTIVGIPEKHQAIVAKKIKDCKLTLSTGSIPVAIDMMDHSSLPMSCSLEASRPQRSPENSLPTEDFLTRCHDDEPDSPVPGVPGRDSPKPRYKVEEKGDKKTVKKKWQEDMIQMENERQRRLAQLHVLDASIGAQTQMLGKLKNACVEEESKVGKLRGLEEELTMLRGRYKLMQDEEKWREEEITEASEESSREVKARKAAFLKGAHKTLGCMLCLRQYTLFHREHHCRVCYRSCCDACSRSRMKGDSTRCCDWCQAEIVIKSSSWDREVKDSKGFRLTQLACLKMATHAIDEKEPDLVTRAASISPTPPLRPRVLSNGTLATDSGPPDSVLDRM